MNIQNTDTAEIRDVAVLNTREIVFKRYGRLNYRYLSKEIEKLTGRKITSNMVSHVINHTRGPEWIREALAEIIGVAKHRLFLGSKLASVQNNSTTAQIGKDAVEIKSSRLGPFPPSVLPRIKNQNA
jgi:hypothetical protein